MSSNPAIAQPDVAPGPAILCVDDEPNILSALRRLFRGQGYRVHTAESAKAGLELLEREQVDLVISDMRMPEMNGADFLEIVRARWPATLRLLLTGYADVESILGAINRGEIYRYITKPWDDSDIVLMVRHALERVALEKDKARLEALTLSQNESLRELNATLEQKVEQRTGEVVAANERLKNNFLTSIKIFSSLIEMRGGALVGHSRRVAELARLIATRMDLPAREVQDLFIAGLLHELGKIGFTDDLLRMPVSLLKGDYLGQYRKYPLLGEQLLMPLEELHEVARIIRSHKERFDGEGFPDALAGFDIPLGARILAVAGDFYSLQAGMLTQASIDSEHAADLVAASSGKRYDPAVVEAFYGIRTGKPMAPKVAELSLPVAKLLPGMRMSRDLVTRDGALLLSADHVLSARLIAQIADFEHRTGETFVLHVRQEKRL